MTFDNPVLSPPRDTDIFSDWELIDILLFVYSTLAKK